jgi:ABC-type branched-subunit amino acid transport system ATPase component
MMRSPIAAAFNYEQTEESHVLVRTHDLRKAYGGQLVLDGLTCALHQGEVVLLRGANGSGKTTLLNILTGYLEPDSGTIQLSTNSTVNRMKFPRPWWKNANLFDHFTPERMARAGIGRTWQDIRLFHSQTASDNVAVATPHQRGENPLWATFRRRMVAVQERENMASSRNILAEVGLGGRADASAAAISLGQSKRVAVARAIQAGARVLFLDEPLAGLDSAGIADTIHLLKKLVERGGLTLLIVEHILNIPFILPIATTVWTLEDGHLRVESAANVRATRSRELIVRFEDMIRQSRPDVDSSDHRVLSGGAVLSTLAVSRPHTDAFDLEVADIVVRRGRRLVIGTEGSDGTLRGLTFRLRPGELAVLHAPNGWGKTTLLEAIAGLVPIERGEIRLNGRRIDHLQPWERARLGLSLLQSRSTLFGSLTARETLSLAYVNDIPEGIESYLGRRVSTLSGGEARKLALACAAQTAFFKIGLFDEPLTALDQEAVRRLCRELPNLLVSGALLVAVPSAAFH